MKTLWPVPLLLLALQTQDPERHSTAQQKLLADLTAQGVRVDLEAQTIEIDARVNQPADPIEYALIHRHGKMHEALLVTEAKPSLLNSAFLLLGFDQGRNAKLEPIEPPPSEEEIAKGAETDKLIPPEGAKLWLLVRWQDAASEATKTAPIEDLILDMTAEKPIEANDWIYLGGRMAPLYRNEPAVYVADYEGNLFSTCYLAPDNHLVTMRHERAREDENWWVTDVCPPPGTTVVVVICKQKPKEVEARELRLAKAKADARSR